MSIQYHDVKNAPAVTFLPREHFIQISSIRLESSGKLCVAASLIGNRRTDCRSTKEYRVPACICQVIRHNINPYITSGRNGCSG